MNEQDQEIIQSIKVAQAVRALDDLANELIRSKHGLRYSEEHDLWREFKRIEIVKDPA